LADKINMPGGRRQDLDPQCGMDRRLLLGMARSLRHHRDDGAVEQLVSPGLLLGPDEIFVNRHCCFRQSRHGDDDTQ
jgi:hypothetical protein